jgi:hypothetical protein
MFCIPCISALFSGAALAQGGSGPEVYVVAPSEVPIGGTFTCQVNVSYIEDLDSGQFELSFDSALI